MYRLSFEVVLLCSDKLRCHKSVCSLGHSFLSCMPHCWCSALTSTIFSIFASDSPLIHANCFFVVMSIDPTVAHPANLSLAISAAFIPDAVRSSMSRYEMSFPFLSDTCLMILLPSVLVMLYVVYDSVYPLFVTVSSSVTSISLCACNAAAIVYYACFKCG